MIGTMDTYVVIERPVITKDELNNPQNTWEEFEPAWVNLRLKSSSESVTEDQQTSKATYELKTHYMPDLKNDFRVVIDGDYFNIIGHDSPFRSRTIITVEQTSYDRRN